jgi:hypothetical protein
LYLLRKTNGKENIPKKNNIPDDFLNFEESPWEFDLIVENIDIEEKFIGLRETLYKPKNKSTSFNYGIIDLNDQNIQIELGTSVKKYFEEFLDRYKPKNTNTEIATQLLKELNIVSNHNRK